VVFPSIFADAHFCDIEAVPRTGRLVDRAFHTIDDAGKENPNNALAFPKEVVLCIMAM